MAWLERARWDGSGPKFYKLGRSVRYLKSDLIEFVESRQFQHTAEYEKRNTKKRGRNNGLRKNKEGGEEDA